MAPAQKTIKKQERQRRHRRSHPFNHILYNIMSSMYPSGKATLKQSNVHLIPTPDLQGLWEATATTRHGLQPQVGSKKPARLEYFQGEKALFQNYSSKPPPCFWNPQDITSNFTKKIEAMRRTLPTSANVLAFLPVFTPSLPKSTSSLPPSTPSLFSFNYKG